MRGGRSAGVRGSVRGGSVGFLTDGAEGALSPDFQEDLHVLMNRELGYAPPVSEVRVDELKNGMFRVRAKYMDNVQRLRTFELPLRRPGGLYLTFDTVSTPSPGGAGLLRLAVRLLPPGSEPSGWRNNGATLRTSPHAANGGHGFSPRCSPCPGTHTPSAAAARRSRHDHAADSPGHP